MKLPPPPPRKVPSLKGAKLAQQKRAEKKNTTQHTTAKRSRPEPPASSSKRQKNEGKVSSQEIVDLTSSGIKDAPTAEGNKANPIQIHYPEGASLRRSRDDLCDFVLQVIPPADEQDMKKHPVLSLAGESIKNTTRSLQVQVFLQDTITNLMQELNDANRLLKEAKLERDKFSLAAKKAENFAGTLVVEKNKLEDRCRDAENKNQVFESENNFLQSELESYKADAEKNIKKAYKMLEGSFNQGVVWATHEAKKRIQGGEAFSDVSESKDLAPFRLSEVSSNFDEGDGEEVIGPSRSMDADAMEIVPEGFLSDNVGLLNPEAETHEEQGKTAPDATMENGEPSGMKEL